ncbi:MAG: hypothetical protein ACREJ2_17190 [Planctomycetota bacterium]
MSFSPRLVGDHRADFYNLKTLLASPPFAGKKGEALVLAIYDYFTSTVNGTYHFWPVDEHEGEPRIRRNVWDAVKSLNAYGWMVCGQMSACLYALYKTAGFEARQFGVPGHSLCEVFYDGRWHILDVDMWTWFRTPEGHIASAYELAQNAQQLIVANQNKSNPCNLPDRTLAGYANMYQSTPTVDDHVETICPPWLITAHTMDFRLRPGETLVRSQEKHGRFVLPRSWRENFTKYQKEWKGEPRERYEPFRTYANGRWTYAPKLSAAHGDFAFATWQREGLTQDAQGLVGPGSFTIRMQSPYPFCARPDFSGPEFTYADGISLELSGHGGVAVAIDTPERTWLTVPLPVEPDADFACKLDLSEPVQQRYGCLVRVTLEAGARLSTFAFDGYLMTAPLALPSLAAGANPMTLHLRDKFDLPTIPFNRIVDFRAAADPLREAHATRNAVAQPYIKGWQVLAPQGPGPVEAVYRFDATAGTPTPAAAPAAADPNEPGTIAWFCVVATLREGPVGQPQGRAKIDWSTDGKSWEPLCEGPISNSHLQWDCGLQGELRLHQPAPELFLRVTSATPLSGLEFYGHRLDPYPDAGRLEIEHHWTEGGRACQFRAPENLADGSTYSVVCGPDPRAHTILMHVPSIPATVPAP